MVQAAVNGVIDFSKAEFRNPMWWRRMFVLLDAYKSEHNFKLARARQNYYLASMQLPQGETKAANEAAIDAYNEMQAAVYPWYDAARQEEDANAALKDAWIEAFGDPATPLVAEEIENTIQNMLAAGEVDEEARSPEDDGFVAWIRRH